MYTSVSKLQALIRPTLYMLSSCEDVIVYNIPQFNLNVISRPEQNKEYLCDFE